MTVKRNDPNAIARSAEKAFADGKLTKKEWSDLSKEAAADGLLTSERRALGAVVRQRSDALTPAVTREIAVTTRALELDSYDGHAVATAERGALDDPKLRTDSHAAYAHVEGSLFVGGAKARDVVQGSIGDCYIMATLSALAQQRPETLKALVRDDGKGAYIVTLHVRGKPQEIHVDADLPVQGGGFSLGRSSTQGELWPAIVEKAIAQWRGGYDWLAQGGEPAEVIELVTGLPSTSVNFRNWSPLASTDSLFADLRSGLLQKNDVVVAGTPNAYDPTELARAGLIPKHAYSLLAATERDGVKFVTLRNPWAQIEPDGDKKNDGVFEMRFDRFLKLFETLTATYG